MTSTRLEVKVGELSGFDWNALLPRGDTRDGTCIVKVKVGMREKPTTRTAIRRTSSRITWRTDAVALTPFLGLKKNRKGEVDTDIRFTVNINSETIATYEKTLAELMDGEKEIHSKEIELEAPKQRRPVRMRVWVKLVNGTLPRNFERNSRDKPVLLHQESEIDDRRLRDAFREMDIPKLKGVYKVFHTLRIKDVKLSDIRNWGRKKGIDLDDRINFEELRSCYEDLYGRLTSSSSSAFRVDDKVEAKVGNWKRYYKGRISKVNSDGTFDITFEDGDRKYGVEKYQIRRQGDASPERPTSSSFRVDDKVEAKVGSWKRYYKGRITKV
eukprot:g4027.t1